jgi:hypothetical protein
MAHVDLLSHLEDIGDAIAGFEDYLANSFVRRGVERCIEILSAASRDIPAKRKAGIRRCRGATSPASATFCAMVIGW